MLRKIILSLVIFLIFVAIFNLGRQIYQALETSKRLDKSIEDLSKLQDQNKELKKQLSQVETFDFVEQQARNKLNLARPDETVVIIPNDLVSKVTKQYTPLPKSTKLSNLQGWLKLFFH